MLTKFLALFSESSANHSASTQPGTPLSVTVQGISGPTVVIQMLDSDTVGALKAKVAFQIDFDASQLTLVRMFFRVSFIRSCLTWRKQAEADRSVPLVA